MVKTRKIRLRVIKSANARDQSAFCAFHTFLVEVQTNAGYIMRRMRNDNLEIRIAGFSCRLQLNTFIFTIFKFSPNLSYSGMINSVGRALVCRAGSRRFIFRERVESYLERGRSGGSRAQFPGSSRREEQEAAGSISGTGGERGVRGRWFNFRALVGERSKSLQL